MGHEAFYGIGFIFYVCSDFWCLCLNIVDFDSFLKVLNRPGGFRDPGEPEEYCRGFQVFDKDMTGYIGVGQLRYSKSYPHSRSMFNMPLHPFPSCLVLICFCRGADSKNVEG